MKSHRNVVDEFRRAIFVDKDRAPKGWSKLVMPVVAEFQRKSASIEEREEWDRVAQRLLTRYVDREVGGTYISEDVVQHLLKCAWNARENAFVIGPTRVGCAVLESNGQAFTGCNVEHKLRSHDVHAEVNAISSMIAFGCYTLMIVAAVADRDRFTPCGACMDWIMQFSKGECVIITQAKAGGPLQRYTARELMPFYPL